MAIRGNPWRAMATSDMVSPRLLLQASRVSPSIASDRPATAPEQLLIISCFAFSLIYVNDIVGILG